MFKNTAFDHLNEVPKEMLQSLWDQQETFLRISFTKRPQQKRFSTAKIPQKTLWKHKIPTFSNFICFLTTRDPRDFMVCT